MYGTLNDVLSAIALLLVIPSVLRLNEMLGGAAGGWLLPLTIVTVAGLLIAAVGQFLLVARVIDLSSSFVTGGLGIVPALAWVVALVWLSLGRHLLQETLGWLSLALLVSATSVAVFSGLRLHFATWTSAAVLIAVLLAWLAMLGVAFLGS